MKAIIATVLLSFTLVTISAAQDTGSLDALNNKYGFRDAQFEAPVTGFKGLTIVENGRLTKSYVRATDSKRIGGAEIISIRYYFYKNRLSSVVIRTKGLANSRALFDALVAQYGEAEQPNDYLKKYYWDATRVKMAYDENEITNDAVVIMMSKPMAWQQNEDEAAAARKAASDL